MLEVGSGISPEYIAGRGYWTAFRRADVPDVFAEWQRLRGLVIPTLSPSGARGVRLRPDRPRKRGLKYEQPSGVGNMLDVHPFNFDGVRNRDVELWVTEGEKTADSLACRGECVVSIPGVHNFALTDSRGAEPLECWRFVPLEDRIVTVAYDSDCLTNANVQLALERLVALLEGRGADVYVVYLPGLSDG